MRGLTLARLTFVTASLLLLAWSPSPAQAADHEVRMVNAGPDHAMQFDPQLLKVAPGDTVHFIAVNKGHNAESISGMTPDGAQPFAGKIGEDLTVTLTVPGVYGYRCEPHGSMGMVGLIVVGSPVNEEKAKSASTPGMAHQTFAKIFQLLDAQANAQN